MTPGSLSIDDRLEIPADVYTLDGFRRWLGGDWPEPTPRATFASGKVHVEMSPQSYETHEPVVKAFAATLLPLATALDLGEYFIPPSWITAEPVLSTEPDGFLVTWATFQEGRVRRNPDREDELLGAPDMALEVVSRSSATKDLVDLARDYAAVGVREYWTVDARLERLAFRIGGLQVDGSYVAREADGDGFVRSEVWGRAFRLERGTNRAGRPTFRLVVR